MVRSPEVTCEGMGDGGTYSITDQFFALAYPRTSSRKPQVVKFAGIKPD